MKTTIHLALLSAAFGLLPVTAAEVDCLKLALTVKEAVASTPAKVLEIVEAQVRENPACACDVVKAAIEGSKADAKLVASIVEVAAVAAPEQMRLVSQCAVAAAPDALANVQAVLAKLDPNSGESGYSSKSAKDAKGVVAPAVEPPNPLDLPAYFQYFVPPVINIPEVTTTFSGFSDEYYYEGQGDR